MLLFLEYTFTSFFIPNTFIQKVFIVVTGMGGGVGGRSEREGIYVYIQLIHFVVQQKLTQHCKATILQLKKTKVFIDSFYLSGTERGAGNTTNKQPLTVPSQS